jgi:hypothetical protein
MFVYRSVENGDGVRQSGQLRRRGFILSATGAALALGGVGAPSRANAAAAATPTDDELASASFGQAAELLLQDFYTKAQAAKVVLGAAAKDVARGGLNAGEHQAALAKLLTDAGQTALLAEDFEFAWPKNGFASAKSISELGLRVTEPLLGTYLGAAATISIASYRTLFASMAANLAQQVGALSSMSGGRIVGVSFPPAVDVETASDAIEAYLG